MKDQELKILAYIREGKCNLVDFADCLHISAPAANYILEDLEKNGYVVRRSYTGINSFSYDLTDKGVAELPALNEKEAALINAGISAEQYKMLAYLAKATEPTLTGKVVKEAGLNTAEFVSNVTHLVSAGMVADSGIIRRRISITEKGKAVVKKLADVVSA